jgi:hypothetical protein
MEYEFIYFLKGKQDTKDIYIAGTFNNWRKVKMKKDDNNKYYYKTMLIEGTYEYKYVIDDIWIYNEDLPFIKTKCGIINNVLTIKSNDYKSMNNANKWYEKDTLGLEYTVNVFYL